VSKQGASCRRRLHVIEIAGLVPPPAIAGRGDLREWNQELLAIGQTTCGGNPHKYLTYPDGGSYPCADLYFYPNDDTPARRG